MATEGLSQGIHKKNNIATAPRKKKLNLVRHNLLLITEGVVYECMMGSPTTNTTLPPAVQLTCLLQIRLLRRRIPVPVNKNKK